MAISTAAAIIGSAAISGGAALLAGGAQADAASQAAALQAEATRESVGEQRRQFNLLRGDLAPYRETGQNALAQYAALYGIGRGGGGGDNALVGGAGGGDPPGYPAYGPDNYFVDAHARAAAQGIPLLAAHRQIGAEFTAANPPGATDSGGDSGFLSQEEMQAARDRFMETPGYQFRFDEGIRALDRSASATGRLRGGGYTRELTRYGQGVASGEFENYANRLSGLAGMGQGSTVSTGTLGVQTGANIGNTLTRGAALQGNALMAAGTARASGYAGAANAASGLTENYLAAKWHGLL